MICLICSIESRDLCMRTPALEAAAIYIRRSAGRAYLQIVESRRDGEHAPAGYRPTLGCFDELQASGQL
jgi:hypothetical protein